VDKISTLFSVHQKHVMYCEECNIDVIMTVSHTAVVCYAGTSKAEKILTLTYSKKKIRSTPIKHT